jgi:hypothetical protein
VAHPKKGHCFRRGAGSSAAIAIFVTASAITVLCVTDRDHKDVKAWNLSDGANIAIDSKLRGCDLAMKRDSSAARLGRSDGRSTQQTAVHYAGDIRAGQVDSFGFPGNASAWNAEQRIRTLPITLCWFVE